MRVLVTGATGFIGSHTVAALLGRGHDVRVLARRPDRVGSVLRPLGADGVDVAAGDMTDVDAVGRALDGCGVYGPQSPHLDGSFAALMSALQTFMVDTDGGMGVVDVRDLLQVMAAAVEPAGGPRRYVAGGRFLTWAEWAATLSEAVGREVPTQRMTVSEIVDLGRQLDQQRAQGVPVDVPLSEEAAVIMSAGVPTDDSPTLAALGGHWRPPVETFRDTVAWLVARGHLPPKPAVPG